MHNHYFRLPNRSNHFYQVKNQLYIPASEIRLALYQACYQSLYYRISHNIEETTAYDPVVTNRLLVTASNYQETEF